MSVSGNVVSSRHDDGRRRRDARGSVRRLAQTSARSGTESHSHGRVHRRLVSLAILGACAILIALFSDLIQDIDYRAMVAALRHTPVSVIVWSVCATALSFAALVGRDASALRHVGARASLSALLLASFCGTALGNAVGFGTLTAAAVRYRIYGAVGIKSDDIARLLLFVLAGFAVGLAGIGGLAGLIEVEPVAALLGWPADVLRVVAVVSLAAAVNSCFRPPWTSSGRPVLLHSPNKNSRGGSAYSDLDPPHWRCGGSMAASSAHTNQFRQLRGDFLRSDRAWRGEPYSGRPGRLRSRRAVDAPWQGVFGCDRRCAVSLSRHLLRAPSRPVLMR
jgi:hypothetical protein